MQKALCDVLDFYYMGEVEPIGQRETTINDNRGNSFQ